MHIAWHDVAFDVPDHWEVTRYSIASEIGRIEFAGREGALGVLSWETCTRPPDEERILTEHHRRYLKQHDKEAFQRFTSIKTLRAGTFLAGCPANGEPCQAVAHLERQSKVIMWMFPAFSMGTFEHLWRPILESLRPNDGAWRAWSMFGIRCQLPRDFELDEAACKPADAWLAFERKNLHKVDLHRWGVPRELLRGRDIEAFFRNVVRGHDGRVLDSCREPFRGMDSVTVSTEVRGTHGMDRLYGSRWHGAGRIWHDMVEKRLYAWVQAAPRKVDLLDEQELLLP